MEETDFTLNSTGKAVSALEKAYDAEARAFLAEKSILAYILKDTVEEFHDFSVSFIAEHCIASTPQIGTIGVDKDETNPAADTFAQGTKISGIANEDPSKTEGQVRYDIRFLAVVPQSGEPIRMIINVEAQQNYYPGYPIVTRGLYYAARMFTAQKDTEFKGNHYGKACKVCSIWICFNVPEYKKNTIERFQFQEDFIACTEKSLPEPKKSYDLMCVVILGLGDPEKAKKDGILRLLSTAFSKELNQETKLQVLEQDFNIPVTEAIESEVNTMCNISQGIWEEGIEKGKKEATLSDLRNIMETFCVSAVQAVEALKITGKDRDYYLQVLG